MVLVLKNMEEKTILLLNYFVQLIHNCELCYNWKTNKEETEFLEKPVNILVKDKNELSKRLNKLFL
jgi:hypothetical protein